MKGFLPWLGGKNRLAPKIVDYIHKIDHQCYVEPFMGAAHVFFNKEISKVEILNDINTDLATLFRVLQHHLEEFCRYFKWALCSQEEFNRLNSQNADSLTDIQKAARFYYLQKLCFGGKPVGRNFGVSTTSPPRLNLVRLEEDLSQVHLRLSRVLIENLDYHALFERYDRVHSLFYIDSPYYNCEDDYGKGIFSKEDFNEIKAILKGLKGNFILSINDVPEIRKIFKTFNMKKVSVPYSVGKSSRKQFAELLISSVDLGSIK